MIYSFAEVRTHDLPNPRSREHIFSALDHSTTVGRLSGPEFESQSRSYEAQSKHLHIIFLRFIISKHNEIQLRNKYKVYQHFHNNKTHLVGISPHKLDNLRFEFFFLFTFSPKKGIKNWPSKSPLLSLFHIAFDARPSCLTYCFDVNFRTLHIKIS